MWIISPGSPEERIVVPHHCDGCPYHSYCKGAGCLGYGIRVSIYNDVGYPVAVVDNSDAASIVEQSQQRCWLQLYSFIIPCLWLCGISYALCLSPSLLQCCWVLLSLSSACLVVLCLMQFSLSKDLGFYSLFYPMHNYIALWDSLPGLVHSGISCLASQTPYWTAALWDGLSGL